MDYHLKQWKPQHQSDQPPSAKTPKLIDPHKEPSQSVLPLFLPEHNSRFSDMSAFPDSTTTTRVPGMGSFFSLNQWQELELQALIFKYMLAGAAVPPELLYPIKKSLLSGTACYLHHGPYHQYQHYEPAVLQSGSWGRSGVDPEPGRCKRTDGKKWRCSRNVVAGHKYCERHMNRGRNRSRKPVEIPTPTAPGGGGGDGPSLIAASTLTAVASGTHFALPGSTPSIDLFHLNQRSSECKAGNGEIGLESSGASGEGGSQAGRGVLRHFFDDWPRLHHHLHQEEQPNTSPMATTSATCLSISIPGNGTAPSDFSLKLSTGNGDDDVAAEMGSEVGVAGDRLQQQRQQLVNSNSNWSMGWGGYPVASMGGPLAEALRSSSTTNSSPTSVLHELPPGSVSEASSVST